MEMMLANAQQHEIANLLWVAEDDEQVQEIIHFYGTPAVVVREMMIATLMDDVTDTDLAEEVLRKFQ